MTSAQVDGYPSRWLDAFVPARCGLCRGPSSGGPFCEGCTQSLPWMERPCRGCAMPLPRGAPELCADCLKNGPRFEHAWAAFRLLSPVQHLIHRLKYSADLAAAHALGTLAAQQLARRSKPLPELIIAVPLHHRRLRSRGYNQAIELVRAMKGLLAIPTSSTIASRVRATSDQIGQSAAERRKNLKGAFAIAASLQGKHIALVDDVMTTGATLAELAAACRAAGATRIEAWAIARAL